MITKYKTQNRLWTKNLISSVDVERETDKCVWINGRREAKESDYYSYFNTFEKAKNHLISVAENRLNHDSERFKKSKELFINVSELSMDDVSK